MKNAFRWCLKPDDDELDQIWNTGVLTVDANVLLDMYRYHKDTRESLLNSIKSFRGKKWLSFQTATEFFRNRTRVIVSAKKTFNEALKEVEKLAGSVESTCIQLKGNRIVPSNIVDNLQNSINPLIKTARDSIASGRTRISRFY